MEANEIGDGKALAKKRKWSDLEEATLIQSVVEREGDLFGDFKGWGRKRNRFQEEKVGMTYAVYSTRKYKSYILIIVNSTDIAYL